MGFDTFGRIQHHNGGIYGGQHAVGIFGKVFVARCVRQVKGNVAVIEGHDGGGDGNAAFLFNFHPVGMGAAIFTAGFDGSGLLNGTAEKQQLFG